MKEKEGTQRGKKKKQKWEKKKSSRMSAAKIIK